MRDCEISTHLVEVAIETATTDGYAKLKDALTRMTESDASLEVKTDRESSHQIILAGSTEEDKRFEQESIQVDEVPGDIHEQALQETTSTKEQR